MKTEEEEDALNGDENSQDDSTAMETDKLEESSAQPVGFNVLVILPSHLKVLKKTLA